jgi:TusA-related sulfurtransferase
MGASKIQEGRYRIDLRGLVCPYPVLLTKKALEELKIGEILEVIVDNPPSLDTVPNSVRASGHKVLEIREVEPAVQVIIISKA